MKMLFGHYGREFLLGSRLNVFHRIYVAVFGVPISGLRIRLRRILPKIQGEFGSIVDLGCGEGIFSFELARRFPQATVTGVDIDENQVKRNEEIVRAVGAERIRFERADILDLKYENSYDLALSVDNLEHIEDDVSALRSIYRAIKPGGTLICHVPAHDRIWIFRGKSPNFSVVGHVRPGYRQEELRSKLIQAGFTISWLEPTYGYLETVANNLSYLITKADHKNPLAYAFAFPVLNFVAWLGRNQRPGADGAGVLVRATKPQSAV